jgi:hypothetical protein
MVQNVLSDTFSEPVNGATRACIEIKVGDGNLTIDGLGGGEPVLASGTLQYTEKQGVPARSVATSNGQARLALKASGRGGRWFRLPWAACNGATEWQVRLNPSISSDLTVHSDGGNLKLDLAGMTVTRVAADTGGGNVEVTLPDYASDLGVAAKTGGGGVTVEVGSGTRGSNTVEANSGAGNVVVRVPNGLAARIHAKSGLGRVIVDPQFSQLDDRTYQSPGYEDAADKIEIVAKSGAGNVHIEAK